MKESSEYKSILQAKESNENKQKIILKLQILEM
jgi:hypothetical protein